jgi:hypothetical protein
LHKRTATSLDAEELRELVARLLPGPPAAERTQATS